MYQLTSENNIYFIYKLVKRIDNLKKKTSKLLIYYFAQKNKAKNIKKYFKNMLTNKMEDGTIKNVPHNNKK